MNYLNTRAIMRPVKNPSTPPPIPDIAWFKLDGNILDYRGDNVGKTGATANQELYTAYFNQRSCFLCDGSNYITLPSIIHPTTFTFSCWINMVLITNYSRVFDYNSGFRLIFRAKILELSFNDAYTITFKTTLQNVWKHIAFTVDGANLTAFENGFPLPVVTITPLVANPALYSGYIAKSFGGDPNATGAYSDFRIYGTVLSNLEIMGLFYKR